jgi:hypothetical protein
MNCFFKKILLVDRYKKLKKKQKKKIENREIKGVREGINHGH